MTKSPFISGRKLPFKPAKPKPPAAAPKAPEEPDRVLTDEQAARLVAPPKDPTLPALRDHAAFVIGLATGARRGILVNLTLRPIEYTHHVVFTVASEGDHGPPALVPMAREAWALTLPYRAALANFGCTTHKLLRRITVMPKGVRIDPDVTPNGLYFALGRRAAQLGVPGLHPVTMRRSFTTWCKAIGLPQRTIAPMLGVRSRHGNDELGDAAARCWGAVRPHLGLP
jgi:integrase